MAGTFIFPRARLPLILAACLSCLGTTPTWAAELGQILKATSTEQDWLDRKIENAQWAYWWALASTCDSTVRAKKLNELRDRLSRIEQAYRSRFGKDVPDTLVIIESSCVRGFTQQMASLRRNIEEAETYLGIVVNDGLTR